jgi:hypothetical protein
MPHVPSRIQNLVSRIWYSILVLAILVSVNACQGEKGRVSRIWFYTFSDPGTKKDTLLSPASFMMLHPDGSYTRDFGKFEYGQWTVTNGHLQLTNYLSGKTDLAYDNTGITNLKLLLDDAEGANFESMPIPVKEDGPNPFSKEMNHWRLQPGKKESREEIRKRLLNHCQFWEAYFSWAFVNKLPGADVRSTPTNIKIYGNGFQLKPLAELPASWKHCFYDEEDCAIANEIIANIFQTETIAWAKTDSKYKMFLSAFQQMQQYLR